MKQTGFNPPHYGPAALPPPLSTAAAGLRERSSAAAQQRSSGRPAPTSAPRDHVDGLADFRVAWERRHASGKGGDAVTGVVTPLPPCALPRGESRPPDRRAAVQRGGGRPPSWCSQSRFSRAYRPVRTNPAFARARIRAVR